MVFWSINFFAKGFSPLLDQTGWPPVKQRANELWTPEVGIPLGSVAECLSNRGATHKRTGSAGASASSPFAGWAFGWGADNNLTVAVAPCGLWNPAAPVLHYGERYEAR